MAGGTPWTRPQRSLFLPLSIRVQTTEILLQTGHSRRPACAKLHTTGRREYTSIFLGF
jgi:hypothetical protein